MADKQGPPGRPPDPSCTSAIETVMTVPLSKFEAMEAETSTHKRKHPSQDEDVTDVNNVNATKRDRVTPPSLVSRSKYTNLDREPYLVYVSFTDSDSTSGSTLHPIRFGQLMQKLNIKNIKLGGIKRIGRNKISVEFESHEDANIFIESPAIKLKGFVSTIPTFNITRMGVVKGVPTDWSELEVIDNLKSPHAKMLKVRRLNRRVVNEGKSEWVPTSSVVVTFDGQVLPDRVFCFYNSLPVETYNYPTVQCYACCKYGHTRPNCRSKPRCFRCGGDHLGDGCSVEDPKCLYCSGSHPANSRHCPEFIRQKNIKASMAKDNISYSEAARIHAPSFRSFADVTASTPITQTIHQILTQEPRSPRPPPPNYISHSQPSTSSSYKKTILTRPKPHPSLQPGYDRRAHQDIINSFSFSPSPNGCALLDSPPSEKDHVQTIQSIIRLLSSLLVNFPLPDHVATNLISSIKSQHIPSSTVEYQKSDPKKK
ncbi:uncharacterized protein LOC135117294 [Helicoverpa armigera]|uniref:uncharacterized protein LOC135117294 n=1 Tax=Helicoverpa armigera TaxID=29058 RepID=UPI003083EA85